MAEVLITCPCNHCSGFLEFDSKHVGSTVTCPHCQLETTLFHPAGDTLCPSGDIDCPPESTQSTPPILPPASNFIRDPDRRLCATCGTVVSRNVETPGSIWIEILLWLCFIIPGLLYSIWRLAARHVACQCCGSKELLPLDSPRAAAIAAQLHVDIEHQAFSRRPSPAWRIAKALLITAAIMAFLVVWRMARENEAAMRDLDRLERSLR